jgi:hypothetical protein
VSLRFQRVTFRDEALEDLRRLAVRSRVLVLEVFRQLKALDAGELQPTPLRSFAKSGDLRDSGKLVVAVAGEGELRIVVRDVAGGGFVVSEVIMIEDRADDLPYLLAGLRLGRLHDPVRRSEAQRRIDRIRRLREG